MGETFLLCLWVASELRYFGPCFLMCRERRLQIHTLSFPFLFPFPHCCQHKGWFALYLACHSIALSRAKSPQNWLGLGQTAVGKVKIKQTSNFGCSRWLFKHFPCVCLCQPGRSSAFPWRVVQSSKYMEKTPGCCVAVDACFQQQGLLSQLFLASCKFLWKLYLLDWREEILGWKGWVVLMPDSQDHLLCAASKTHSSE